jgi:hypothetical protein
VTDPIATWVLLLLVLFLFELRLHRHHSSPQV